MFSLLHRAKFKTATATVLEADRRSLNIVMPVTVSHLPRDLTTAAAEGEHSRGVDN